MADLKAGSTVGGLPIWHQGTMPLVPVGNSLTYRGYTVYTTNDKPQAADNDFVSKANGGTGSQGFQKEVEFKAGIKIAATFSGGSDVNGIYSGDGDGALLDRCNMDIVTWYGFGIRSSQGSNGRVVVWNTRTGDQLTKGYIRSSSYVAVGQAPTAADHVTRKDYVDNAINTVTTNANNRVLKSGDTMTGNLTVNNASIILTKPASADNQVPWLGQVISKNVTIDFGTF